ncbi:MAG: hypothetical protein WBQ94_01930 [Terracidiphilus sp.]
MAVPPIIWTKSLTIDSTSSGIGHIGGTELRALAVMDGVLYAGNGYWRDTSERDPALPGPQVLVLDSPTASWRVDTEFDDRITGGLRAGVRRYQAIGALYAVQFHSDRSGHPLQPSRSVLLASVWDRLGGLRVFFKNGRSGSWSHTDLAFGVPPGSQIRSFGYHRDSVTGVERVFAGTNPRGIISGAYDSTGSGGIHWDTEPEPGMPKLRDEQRVMSFAECDGRLYATVGWEIYEREDGAAPSWKKVFTWGKGLAFTGSGGLRGLTSIGDPSGKAQFLLVAAEGPQGLILRIAPLEGFKAVTDLDVRNFLSRTWGTAVSAEIVAYNDMTVYPDTTHSDSACPSLLIGGYDAKTPNSSTWIGANHKAPGAYFLVRDCRGHYSSREIVDSNISPKPLLVATRTMILSPFAADPKGTLYAGGFDAGNIEPHNSAWLYRGVPASNKEFREY